MLLPAGSWQEQNCALCFTHLAEGRGKGTCRYVLLVVYINPQYVCIWTLKECSNLSLTHISILSTRYKNIQGQALDNFLLFFAVLS